MSLAATGRAHRVTIFQLSEHDIHFSGRNRPQRGQDRERRFDHVRIFDRGRAKFRVFFEGCGVLFSFVRGAYR